MTGTVKETHLQAIREEQDEEQQSLFEYSQNDDNNTLIAVVSDPVEDVFELCDEHIPELGMPLWKLNEFRAAREARSSWDGVERHNEAYESERCDKTYRSHLKYNEDAAEAVEELVERVRSGEDITLVCFESGQKKCHRYTLKEYLEERI